MPSYHENQQIEQQHKKAVAEHFSKQTKYWRVVYNHSQGKIDNFTNLHMMNRRAVVLRFLDEYAQNRSLRILEVGCGSGGVIQEVLKRGHKVVGTDISGEMLKEAKETTKDYPIDAVYIKGDIERIPVSDNSFDVVICVGVLQYLQNDKKAVGEMNRVLKTDGIVILTLPNIFRISNLLDPYYYLNRGLKYVLYKTYMEKNKAKSLKPEDFGTNDTFRNRRYYYGQLKGLFNINGFCEINAAGIGFGPVTFWRKDFLPVTMTIKISNFFENLARKKFFSIMALFANRWVICFKKASSGNRADK